MTTPNPPKARIRPLAAQDLEEIVRYLDAQSPTASDRFLDEFFHATSILAGMPRLGPVRRTRGRLKGLRSWPLTTFGPYLLFYLPVEGGIEVIRVFHGSRNVDRELRK
jgi:toxin ParE1/3/4